MMNIVNQQNESLEVNLIFNKYGMASLLIFLSHTFHCTTITLASHDVQGIHEETSTKKLHT